MSKQILMLLGDYAEDYEVMVPARRSGGGALTGPTKPLPAA